MSQDADPQVSRANAWVSFDRFDQSYLLPLLRFVRDVGRSDGLSEAHLDAEGVVQDTFEPAYRKWAAIRLPERWVYRVAARKVRQRSRQEWYKDRELRKYLETVYSEKSGEIIDLIIKLPTNQRIATYLSCVEEWTGAEIAEVLDMASSTWAAAW